MEITEENLLALSSSAELIEAEALYLLHSYPSAEQMKRCGGSVARFGGITAIRTDLFPGFSFSRVMGFVATPDAKLVDEIMDFYEGRNGIYALQIPPHLITDELSEILRSRRFFHKNNWARFIRNTEPVSGARSELEIRQISSKESEIFGKMVTGIFEFPEELSVIVHEAADKPGWKHYLAYEGTKAVATGTVYLSCDAAWNCFATTLPEYRGKGAQRHFLKRESMLPVTMAANI